jgi:ring-1,2-phenylacetyl-CoA epoxidase subunit PaaD
MSDAAKEKLRAYGIAPPHPAGARRLGDALHQTPGGRRRELPPLRLKPHRRHLPVRLTACKALYKCLDCQEPFDYFKPY